MSHQIPLELLAAQAWAHAAHDHVRNAVVCITGGLRPEQVKPLRERVRAVMQPYSRAQWEQDVSRAVVTCAKSMRPGPDDDGKTD